MTTAAGTIVPEGQTTKLLDGRLKIAVGSAAGGTIARIRLQAAGMTCAFLRVREGELIGVRVTTRGIVGVKVVAVSPRGATLKAAATRAPRGTKACPRGTA